MKHCLALLCVLGSLCGGVFSAYSVVSVGSDGLKSMAVSLQSVSNVVKKHYTNLNSARNKVWPTIVNMQEYVNTTYTALNNTYGASQQNVQNAMWNVEWFPKQFYYGEQMVNSMLGMDLNQLNSQMQQTIDDIMQHYIMLANSFAYQATGDQCTVQYAAAFSSVPDQLTKFGQCLQIEVDTVPTVVDPLKAMLTLVFNDLKSLNQQIKICAATSTACLAGYFEEVQSELMYINSEMYLAQNYLTNLQQDAMQRNQLCGELIRSNVQDTMSNLNGPFGNCLYPQVMSSG